MISRRAILIGLLAAGPGAAVLPPARAAEKPVRVLLVLLGGGPHDIEKNPPHLERAFAAAGGFEVSRLAPPAGQQGSAAHLARLAELKPGDHGVLVFYTVGQALSPEQERALQGFVDAGGGIVALHGASASFGNSDTWLRLVGARFAGHAPGTYSLPIEPVGTHPITAGVGPFTIEDEEYTHRFALGVERTVVARFRQRPEGSSEKAGNNDAVWTTTAGKGRVVYTCLGHGEAAWSHPAWLKLTLQSVLWAAGRPREVKLPR